MGMTRPDIAFAVIEVSRRRINHSSKTIDCVAKKSVLIEVQNSLLSELTKLKDSRYNGFLFRYQTSSHT
jgi:hypothetical protein